MKKVLLFFLLLIAILINQESIFAFENLNVKLDKQNIEEVKKNEVKKIINDLLKERANLWNDMFVDKTNLEDVRSKLKNIVTEPLFTYDMNTFKQLKKKYTNMDKIIDVNVINVKKIDINNYKVIADIEVEWLMENLSEEYKERIFYRIELVKEENRWKIKDYNLI